MVYTRLAPNAGCILIGPLGTRRTSWDGFRPSTRSKAGACCACLPWPNKVLQGQGNLSQLGDVEHFQNKLFTSFGVPKSFLGVERDQGAKANTSEQYAFWSRSLRRLQQVMTHGVTEVLRRAMILDGIDPEGVEWSVVFPAISSRNEQRTATVQALQADVAIALVSAGLADKEFVYRQVMQLPSDEVERLLKLNLQATAPTAPPGLPKARTLLTPLE